MAGEDSLVDREFIGTILPAKDTVHQGKYKVNVPELQPHMKETTGIWCKNHTCRHRVSPSQAGVSGSYYPLQAGMSVIVKFFANHIESAYIDRVISDAYAETLPYEIIERDDYYQIIRTPKHNNLICIYESDTASKNVPKNSIHVYFNNTRTTVVIDETGINIKTDDNINATVTGNVKLTINGTADIKVTGNANIESVADINFKGSNINLQADTAINIKSAKLAFQSSGDTHIKSAGNNFIDGAANHLKGTNIGAVPAGSASAAGDAGSAGSAALADAPSLITLTDYEYFTRNSGK